MNLGNAIVYSLHELSACCFPTTLSLHHQTPTARDSHQHALPHWRQVFSVLSLINLDRKHRQTVRFRVLRRLSGNKNFYECPSMKKGKWLEMNFKSKERNEMLLSPQQRLSQRLISISVAVYTDTNYEAKSDFKRHAFGLPNLVSHIWYNLRAWSQLNSTTNLLNL